MLYFAIFAPSVSVALWSQYIAEVKTTLIQHGFPVNGRKAVLSESQGISTELEIINKLATSVQIDVCCFGHVGDQNMHLNVLLTWKAGSDGTVQVTAVDSDKYKELLKVS